jgi:hypothetical protein
MMGDGREREQVLVLAPHGRDAALAVQLLTRSGLVAVECASMLELAAALADAGCAIVTEEALLKDGIALLKDGLAVQPAWSDFPFILLASKSAPGRDALGAWHTLGNVTLLDRPTQSRTLLTRWARRSGRGGVNMKSKRPSSDGISFWPCWATSSETRSRQLRWRSRAIRWALAPPVGVSARSSLGKRTTCPGWWMTCWT